MTVLATRRGAPAAAPGKRHESIDPPPRGERRVVDDHGRGWRVRSVRSGVGSALFFSCEVPGLRAEVRRPPLRLDLLSDDELVLLLDDADG